MFFENKIRNRKTCIETACAGFAQMGDFSKYFLCVISERSRPARGAWIETPRARLCEACGMSRPARGAWIETGDTEPRTQGLDTSRPARGAWIETHHLDLRRLAQNMSRPARGAWIETPCTIDIERRPGVAPRAGRVD